MQLVEIQFQTPQDFQAFRKMAGEGVVRFSIADLSIVCNCELLDVAAAINQFGAVVKDAEEQR